MYYAIVKDGAVVRTLVGEYLRDSKGELRKIEKDIAEGWYEFIPAVQNVPEVQKISGTQVTVDDTAGTVTESFLYVDLTAEEKAAIRNPRLKAIRDELTENGGCLVQGKWFHTDVKSKQQQIALTIAGTSLPDNLMWKTMDGSFVLMTPTLAQELFAAQLTREATIFGICEAKQGDDTPINEGWPARYVEAV
jgi:hypothetical protein